MTGLVFLLLKGYKESFLILNDHYIKELDFPMFLLTHIGNGLMILSLLTILWSKDKLNLIICAIISVILSGLMVQFLKNIFFGNWSRPLSVFYHGNPPIHIYPGYELIDNTFPSGHSTTIAAVFTIIAFAYRDKNKFLLTALSLLSVIIIYTRVYLGVHFLGDILAGSFLGMTFSFVTLRLLLTPISVKVMRLYTYPKASFYLLLLGLVMFVISIFVVYKNL